MEKTTKQYIVSIDGRELAIIQDALNAYGKSLVEPAYSPKELFETMSDDQSDYTIFQVQLLWRSLQSRYEEVGEK